MSSPIATFICYRRRDAYMRGPNGDKDETFIQNLEAALKRLSPGEIFRDLESIHVLEDYENSAFDGIKRCDLFVALIGADWLKLLKERTGKRDAVVREIVAALKLEKRILILQVDGAAVPAVEELPSEIARFHYQNGEAIGSRDTIDAMAKTLTVAVKEAAWLRSVRNWWTAAYCALAVAMYYVCGILVHQVGIREYGWDAWTGMAKAWSGFFIWPALFLPFVLYALYRPLTTLVHSILSASSFSRARVFLIPLVCSSVLAAAAWFVEVFDPLQVPWTIFPALPQPGCASPPPRAAGGVPASLSGRDRDILAALSSYDRQGTLAGRFPEPQFWLSDKCWPNVFFYLTVPVYSGTADAAYVSERVGVQKAFMTMLGDKYRTGIGVPNSATALVYRISFAILVWLGVSGVVMAGFFMVVKIKDSRNGTVRILPSEDAFICLTYSLATLMTWVPFRMNTEYYKYIYQCAQLPCELVLTRYFPDMLLGALLFMGYLFATLSLLAQFSRYFLVICGTAVIALCAVGGFVVYRYRDTIAVLADNWQFYVIMAIPTAILLFVLWLFFDPGLMRDREVKRALEAK